MGRALPAVAWGLVGIAGVLVQVALARPAHAERVLIVVDAAAARDDTTWPGRTMELAAAFTAARHEVGVLAVSRTGGRVRVHALEDPAGAWPAQDTTSGGAAAAVAASEGATSLDIREVFRVALERHRVMRPLWLVTVGPFEGDAGSDDPGVVASLALATNRWNGTAPLGSRLFTVGLGPAGRARFTEGGAPAPSGWQAAGWLVLAAGPILAEARPWSPWDPTSEVRAVEVHAPWRALPLGTQAPDAPPFAVGAAGGEALAAPPGDTDVGTTTITWPAAGPAPTLIDVTPRPGDTDVWLAPVPTPLAVPGLVLAPAARLLDADGATPAAFQALDVLVDAPVETTWRLQHTRTGAAPRWQVGSADGPALPPGLEMDLGEEREVDAHVAETEVHVRMTAQAAQPLEQEGRLRLAAGEAWPAFTVPYVVRVAPGRVRLEALAGGPRLMLPPAAADAALEVRLARAHPNAPARARLLARTEPPERAAAFGLDVRVPGRDTVRWSLEHPLEVPTDTTLRLVPVLAASARPEDVREGTLHLEVAAGPGIQAEGALDLELVVRRPRLVREGSGPARYALVDGTVRAIEPLVVRLQDEGLDGPWLVAWLAEPPRADLGIWIGNHPQSFRFVADGPGRWVLVAEGAWSGPGARTFDASTEAVRVTPRDRAGRALEEVRVEIDVRARWGARGWLLLALAAMALLLVGLVLLALRPPPVTGTLLYAVEGMGGTVGRLDLAPVGRRRKEVRADARGRLALDGPGKALARVQAERIGGVLTLIEAGADGERRLLVDGLTWRTGRHALRYLSGREATRDAGGGEDVPDLLGADFEIGTGRVRDAWQAAGGATDEVFGGTARPDEER